LPTVNGTSHVFIDLAFLDKVRTGYERDVHTKKLLEQLQADSLPPHLKAFRVTNDGILLFQSPKDKLARSYIPSYDSLRLDVLHDLSRFHDLSALGVHQTPEQSLPEVFLGWVRL
jgi:hypothetical protein